MKLIVVIPAFNEEENIQEAVKSIPRKIMGIKEVVVMVVDDGSTDKTCEFAMNAGADKIVSHHDNMGVGAAFMTGIRNAISQNADVLVTIDADSQFDPKQISELIVPILNQQLDVVIGSRFLDHTPKNIPKIKLLGNKIFTKIMSRILGQKFTDTQSGFRAYSKEAIMNIVVVNEFTYTQEVIIDLKFKNMRIGEIPVSVTYNEKRKSRVVKNVFHYTIRSLSIIVKSLVFHKPITSFGLLGTLLCATGLIAKIITYVLGGGVSAGLSTGLILLGIVSFMLAIFANIVFKRQTFAEKDLRHYIKDINKTES